MTLRLLFDTKHRLTSDILKTFQDKYVNTAANTKCRAWQAEQYFSKEVFDISTTQKVTGKKRVESRRVFLHQTFLTSEILKTA